MQTTEDTIIIQKTRELCQTLLDQPEFASIRQRMDTFMADEDAKSQYQLLNEKGEFLTFKQKQGQPLADEEVAEFEGLRQKFLNNPVAQGFLDAQQEMHQIQESVGAYVGKTFELGRVPESEDFDSGSCGPSCGCSH
ncbi:MAG: YlbF family regulator [Opitutaceae bacterium]|nr:YlbF family regulator [Verrucomicrobiales bacterium]